MNTPDGWILALGAKDERQLPVAPLTTALSSREYVSSGIFVGSLVGPETPRGSLEVGYEIGCGIDMSTSQGVTIGGAAGINPGLGYTGPLVGVPTGVLPVISTPIQGLLDVGLKSGSSSWCRWSGNSSKVHDFHVKIDGCVGQSFIRSYATLTRATDQSDVVLSYIGTTKAV